MINRLWLYQAEHRYSKKNEESYVQLYLWDNESGYTYITYVSTENYNSKPWVDILNLWQPDQVICISGDFKAKLKTPHVINADQKPRYEGMIKVKDFCDLVYQAWASEIDPAYNTPETLEDYFS
jgi:hypothetical protein